jgi:hypothetical protein
MPVCAPASFDSLNVCECQRVSANITEYHGVTFSEAVAAGSINQRFDFADAAMRLQQRFIVGLSMCMVADQLVYEGEKVTTSPAGHRRNS